MQTSFHPPAASRNDALSVGVPTKDEISLQAAGSARGRAIGAVVFALFGALWFNYPLVALQWWNTWTVGLLLAGTLLPVVSAAAVLGRTARPAQPLPGHQRKNWLFWNRQCAARGRDRRRGKAFAPLAPNRPRGGHRRLDCGPAPVSLVAAVSLRAPLLDRSAARGLGRAVPCVVFSAHAGCTGVRGGRACPLGQRDVHLVFRPSAGPAGSDPVARAVGREQQIAKAGDEKRIGWTPPRRGAKTGTYSQRCPVVIPQRR
jgi:hypothetical protein